MPDVTIRILNSDAPIGYQETLKEIKLPREHWDIRTVEKQLEDAGWFRADPNRGYNPFHAMADLISENIEEFDGMNLDVRIEIRMVSEEQRYIDKDGEVR